ncbi:MAG: hypothetical protein ACLTXT_00420, partial [Ruminococcus callidus]
KCTFLEHWKMHVIIFSIGWCRFIGHKEKRNMKDSNEYGRNVKAKSKTDKTLRLGKVTLIFGAGGSLTDENIDTFLHDVKAIDVLTVKGLMPDIMENVKYIKEKMEKFGVICGQIRAEITV